MKMAMTLRTKESGTLNYSKVFAMFLSLRDSDQSLIPRDLVLYWRQGV